MTELRLRKSSPEGNYSRTTASSSRHLPLKQETMSPKHARTPQKKQLQLTTTTWLFFSFLFLAVVSLLSSTFLGTFERKLHTADVHFSSSAPSSVSLTNGSDNSTVVISHGSDRAKIYVPFMCAASIPRGFYHVYQCFLTGINITGVDPVSAALHPEHYEFVMAPNSQRGCGLSIMNGFADAYFRISKNVSYEHFVQSNLSAGISQEWLKNHATNFLDFGCMNYELQQSMDWVSTFLRLKHKNLEFPTYGKVVSENVCADSQQIRDRFKFLVVNRPENRHIADGSIAQILQRFGHNGEGDKVQVVGDLGALSITRQLAIFATHNVIILPHGAAEMNLLAATKWKSRAKAVTSGVVIPTAVIEVCPPYLHCECAQKTCPGFYKDRFVSVAFFGLAFEYSDANCSQVCARAGNRTIRHRVKNKDIPAVDFSENIEEIVANKLMPFIAKNCRGEKTELRNTTVTRVVVQRSDNNSTIESLFPWTRRPAFVGKHTRNKPNAATAGSQ